VCVCVCVCVCVLCAEYYYNRDASVCVLSVISFALGATRLHDMMVVVSTQSAAQSAAPYYYDALLSAVSGAAAPTPTHVCMPAAPGK
jgi:hypothetical protein